MEVEGLAVELRQARIALSGWRMQIPALIRVWVEVFVDLKPAGLLDRVVKIQQTLVLVEEQEVSELSVALELRSVVLAGQSFGMSLDQKYMTSLDLPLYPPPHLVSSIWASLQQRCPLAAEL